MRKLAKLVLVLALCTAAVWCLKSPGWGPVTTFLTSLAMLIILLIAEARSEARVSETNPDLPLFEAFLRELPYRGIIQHLDDYGGNATIDVRKLGKLNEFTVLWINAQHEFRDRDLEKKRRRLLAVATEFLDFLYDKTEMSSDVARKVPGKLPTQDPELFYSVSQNLLKLGDELVKCHQDLVRTGLNKLNLPGPTGAQKTKQKREGVRPSNGFC